jgi:hypothetical protein
MLHLLHAVLATARSSLRPQHGSVIRSMTLRSMNSSESPQGTRPTIVESLTLFA